MISPILFCFLCAKLRTIHFDFLFLIYFFLQTPTYQSRSRAHSTRLRPQDIQKKSAGLCCLAYPVHRGARIEGTHPHTNVETRGFSARCTVYVQYMYSIWTLRKRTHTVHILYIYCTYDGACSENQRVAEAKKWTFPNSGVCHAVRPTRFQQGGVRRTVQTYFTTKSGLFHNSIEAQ